MSSDADLEGVRVLRALAAALDGTTSLDEGLVAAARALVPALAEACTIRCADATGRELHATAGGGGGGDRILELPLAARGQTYGAIRLARPGWDEHAVLYAEECASRIALAVETDRLAAAAATAQLYDGFLATLSHELRTPLNVVVGWLDLLQSDRLTHDKRVQALDVIARNATVQIRLIEDILEASRIVSGKMRLELGAVPARDLVVGALESVRPQAEAARIELVVDADAAFTLRGDGVRLAQVVHNLVGNAIRYTPPGGRIDVRLASDGLEATLVVRDTGTGIDPEFLPHVFERFRQGERRRSGGTRGLGLGLFIVRHIVHLHGGTVAAASDGRGKGSAFTVRLPLGGPS